MKSEREKINIDDSFAYKWFEYPSKACIIFVHGLGGNPNKTWGFFPQLLMGSALGQNFDVFCYGYSSSPYAKSSPQIESLVEEFSSFCQSELHQYETIIFISHSLGSVVVNGMLINLEANGTIKKYLAHLMITPAFLGGPVWARFSPSKTARQLSKDSQFLTLLKKQWRDSRVKESIKSYLIYGSNDNVVPIPSDDLSAYNFIAHRINSGHIKSPKITDIDTALYRGVIYAIELALRFNTRDSRNYFINMILKTNKVDWNYDSAKAEWVLLNDFRFSIVELESKERNCHFSDRFPNQDAYFCKFSFRYHELSLYEFYLWSLDGGRYLIPVPYHNGGDDWYIKKIDYALGKILEAGGLYQDLDRGLRRAQLRVDETSDILY